MKPGGRVHDALGRGEEALDEAEVAAGDACEAASASVSVKPSADRLLTL